MNRRQFLQALLAIPAIAALPMPVLAEPSLRVGEIGHVDGVRFLETPLAAARLTIDGEPVEVVTMSCVDEDQFIEVASFHSRHRRLIRGLRNTQLRFETYADERARDLVHNAFREQRRVAIGAQFGGADLVADGYVRGSSICAPVGEFLQLNVDILLTNVRWMAR